jgi:hypothetical protein
MMDGEWQYDGCEYIFGNRKVFIINLFSIRYVWNYLYLEHVNFVTPDRMHVFAAPHTDIVTTRRIV